MAKQQLVLAFFENEAAADEAVNAVKQWDKASKEIKLGAIGILVKDDKGKIKTHKLGKRKTGTGAVLFGLAAVLTGGATLLAGAVFGGIVGSFFRKGLGMSKDDLARIDGELNGGKAAVCILAAPDEAAAVSAKLAELGGQPESHEVSEEVVQEAETAAAETPEEAQPKRRPQKRTQNRPPPDRWRLAQTASIALAARSRREPMDDPGRRGFICRLSPGSEPGDHNEQAFPFAPAAGIPEHRTHRSCGVRAASRTCAAHRHTLQHDHEHRLAVDERH